MAGYVNSWIETFTQDRTPCLRDVLIDGQTGAVIGGDNTDNNTDQSSIFDSLPTCAWWLIGGLLVGHLIKKSKKQ